MLLKFALSCRHSENVIFVGNEVTIYLLPKVLFLVKCGWVYFYLAAFKNLKNKDWQRSNNAKRLLSVKHVEAVNNQ